MSIYHYIGLSLLAALILIAGFIGYIKYNDEVEEELFRKNLIIGMPVIVDNGQQVFVAQVIDKGPGYVRVITPEGKTAAYGLRCIYPVRD